MKKHPYAVAGLAFGILSFIQLLGLEKAAAAVIFGVIALKRIKPEEGYAGKKMAYTAIALGVIYLLILTYFLFFHAAGIIEGGL